MEKIPETVLRLIWSCHFLSLELPQSEVDESQGKPTTQVSTYAFDVYAHKFQSTDSVFIFTSLRSFSHTILCQWIKPFLIFQVT